MAMTMRSFSPCFTTAALFVKAVILLSHKGNVIFHVFEFAITRHHAVKGIGFVQAKLDNEACPVKRILDIFSGKWNMHVLFELTIAELIPFILFSGLINSLTVTGACHL